MIEFPEKQAPIRNALTGEEYVLMALDSLEASNARISEITSICNEPLVFSWLFRQMFPDGRYPTSSAKSWLEWGKEGWPRNTHFVFAVLDAKRRLAAACDIKSSNSAGAEVGYWASEFHRGIMTNAIRELLRLATLAGFARLYAETDEGNLRSRGVLGRAGFIPDGSESNRPNHIVYSIDLEHGTSKSRQKDL